MSRSQKIVVSLFVSVVVSFVLLIGLTTNRNASSPPQPVTTFAYPSSTPVPASTPAPDSRFAQTMDPRKLTADPNTYRGMNIELIGRAQSVSQHDDYTWAQLMAQARTDTTVSESLALEIRPRATSGAVLNGDCYKVYGIVADPQTVTRTLTGASNSVPTLTVYRFEPLTKAPSGYCIDNR
jgi:hypothetical protein